MGSRVFNTAIVLVWFSSMSWLVVVKVLPPLCVGDPPNYRAILNTQTDQLPICWTISWNGNPVGFAASIIVKRADGMREIHSRVFFDRLPLDEMAPGWLGAIVRPMLTKSGRLDMSAESRIEIDPLDHLNGFESKVRLGNILDAIRMTGSVDGTQLNLAVQSGEISFRTTQHLPPNALVGDELSPQAQLPGLRKGQKWTMPIYSPFRPPNSPMEVLQATVDRDESLVWDGKTVDTRVVVYKDDSGSGLLASREPRGRLWVRHDGVVLKQEINLFNSRLQFERATPQVGDRMIGELSKILGPEWLGDLSVAEQRRIWQGDAESPWYSQFVRGLGHSKRRHHVLKPIEQVGAGSQNRQ